MKHGNRHKSEDMNEWCRFIISISRTFLHMGSKYFRTKCIQSSLVALAFLESQANMTDTIYNPHASRVKWIEYQRCWQYRDLVGLYSWQPSLVEAYHFWCNNEAHQQWSCPNNNAQHRNHRRSSPQKPQRTPLACLVEWRTQLQMGKHISGYR